MSAIWSWVVDLKVREEVLVKKMGAGRRGRWEDGESLGTYLDMLKQ